MSNAVHRTGTPSLSIPATQNTAPVLEFNCLYTHDIRRKQKRWQDGFLRFHTFNKRVMVYDVPRNFIGDMHWASGEALQEGDEVMLEKDGVLVEVAQSVGRTETDLTELRASTRKVRGQTSSSPVRGAANTPARSMAPPPARPMTAHTGPQLKHRSLNALLGTPKGVSGRAAPPTKSPFEVRQAGIENAEWESERPAKRSRVDAWSVTRTTTTPKAKAAQEVPLWQRTADARTSGAGSKKKKTAPAADQQRLGTKEVIDLSDDAVEVSPAFLPGFSSDAIMPLSSPAKETSATRQVPPPAPAKQQAPPAMTRSSSPAFQTQELPARTQELPARTCDQSRQRVASKQPAEPALEADRGVKPSKQRQGDPKHIAPPFLPPSTDPSKTLRISSSTARKKTLSCLDQLPKVPPIVSQPAPLREATRSHQSTEMVETSKRTSRERLEERLARIERKKQQRAQDLQAVIDDAGDDTRLEADGTFSAAAGISRLDRTLLLPRNKSPEAASAAAVTSANVASVDDQPHESPPIDHAPAQIAPPPSDVRTRAAPARQARSFQRVLSDNNAAASTRAKRIPGAPVRYTPSPTRRSVASEKEASRASVTPVVGATRAPCDSTTNSEPRVDAQQITNGPQQAVTAAKPMLHPQAREAPPAEATAAPRRKGMGRKEIRQNAADCFQPALDTSANGIARVVLSKPFQAPKGPAVPPPPPEPQDVGPWSRDAFDLFTWRPPGWSEEDWRITPGGGGDATC